jgi:hypothetical protein
MNFFPGSRKRCEIGVLEGDVYVARFRCVLGRSAPSFFRGLAVDLRMQTTMGAIFPFPGGRVGFRQVLGDHGDRAQCKEVTSHSSGSILVL